MSDAADDRDPIDPTPPPEGASDAVAEGPPVAEVLEAATPKRKPRTRKAKPKVDAAPAEVDEPEAVAEPEAVIADPPAPEVSEAVVETAEEPVEPEAVETPEPEAAEPPPPPPAKPPIWKRRPWQIGAAASVAVVIAIVVSLLWSLPLGRALEPLANPTLVIVASDGSPIARRGSYKEAPVDVAKLPAYVPGAFIAIEDRRFYKHIGVDPKAILRAVGANAKAGGVSEGGSTITQQLAKNAFLSNKRTFRRKIQEVLIALYLDARLSKDEILSRYLSSVYFGDGTFGLGAASRHYFDKTPEQLSVGEAAMLAGLVKAPSRWAPTENFEGARTRMKTVLGAMVDTGVITQAQADRAERQVHVQAGRPKLPTGSYFADWVFPQAKAVFENTYGETVVRTTLDPRLQAQAEKILNDAIARDGKVLNVTQGAIVAMRTDGRIVAMVGGRDYKVSQFNRADAERPPGSAFKLFVYLAAIRQGMTPTTPILDAPVQVSGWTPKNHEGKYAGREVPLITAFAASSNVAAVRLAHDIGRDPIVKTARDLGVTDPIPDDLTLALGTGPMSLVRLTAAYAAIDAGEAPVIPHGLADWKKPANVHPLTKAELVSMRDLLRSATQRGTGIEAAIPGAFGKTGTSQDSRDALFVGYVGDLVIGVWVGNDDNSPMNGVVGGGLPAKIWKSVATYAVNRDAPKPAEPEGDDAVSAAEDPTLLNPDGTPVDGAVPVEGAAPADPNAPPVPAPGPAAPAVPAAPVVTAPAAAPATDRPAN
ncbi:transglycosylase domain-containing protein [Caulobacter sp. UNC358MFTsu5.1]|uniref:transglycosylase domain-containing protein n=1 Tax=Caulobacter sp. UNC358MFTsu5.1 TaxID=1449049 RepID=UPI0004A6E448|nr:transglycosylase domain-containing protein [Caulobacter sp. UNC358MFTsu5.1]